ncbi:hypothetical protein PM03_12835 [Thalassobacter stenotrophicus]|uniref:SDR family NAD(P)-dependent oxidoreductase n=1 Tax=Thalassobacter TaxID=266808 RepID=UPI00051DCD02|nr:MULTISPECIES: SDR family NAD(P)-dependent oxidoreductase [Thalassobacter]KGK78872.1 hypothetical protein PM03_12835 [Thalassobacter stenotrophicus]KGL00951.1 short-chain dehydrogenase [Thalassobacter sp. 16PALIMAR09]
MPTAFITGGAKRIGAEIARALVTAGFKVAVHYNTSHSEAETLRAELNAITADSCAVFQGDLSDRASLTRVFSDVIDWLGPLNLLVNNASMFMNDDIGTIDEAQFDGHMAVNLKAPVYLTELTAAQSQGLEDCLIVNMLDNKVFAMNPDFFTYTLSKAALFTATQMLAMRFGGFPRVAGIAPSITLISGKQSQANFEKSSRINPLGRQVTPGEIAQTVLFMWNTKSYNDQILTIDGGQTLWELPRDVAFLVKEGLVDD